MLLSLLNILFLFTIGSLSIDAAKPIVNPMLFSDPCENLDNWEILRFSSGTKDTEYKIVLENNETYLKIKSDSSASGLICKNKFNANEYPILKWKWKIENIIPNADGKTKEGDDYPLRIFVMFEKDSSEITFWEKLKKSAIKLITGYDPPYKSLCYVWANSESETPAYYSPYTDDVKIICLQAGSEKCMEWFEEKVNIVDDYKKYFEEDPPANAKLAIMGDTDNTMSSVISNIDEISLTNYISSDSRIISKSL